MRRKLLSALLPILMGCMCSCVPEIPDTPTDNDSTVVTPPANDSTEQDSVPPAPQPISVDLRMEVLTEWGVPFDVPVSTRATDTIPSDSIRFIVRLQPDGTDSIIEYVFRQRFDEEHVAPMDLLPGRYNLNVWADYQLQSPGTSSSHYSFPRFGEVAVNDTAYAISTMAKDAFYGAANVIIDSDEPTASLKMTLHRPFARVQLVLCDTTRFLQRERERLQLAADAPVNLSAYSARLSYPQYLPTVYNLRHGKPCDSQTGLSAVAPLVLSGDGQLLLAYDYIFTGNNKEQVSVAAEICDPSGVIVWQLEDMDIPILCNSTSSIKMSFEP